MRRKRVIVLTDRIDQRGNTANGVRVAKAFHELGYNVMIMEHGFLNPSQIARADVVLACGTLIYSHNQHEAKTVATYLRPDAAFILWYFDACCSQWKVGRRKFSGVKKVLPCLTWLAMTDDSYGWAKHVKNYIPLMQGVNGEEFTTPVPLANRRSVDIVFTGGYSGAHAERRKLLNVLWSNFKVATFGADSGMGAYDAAFIRVYQDAKIAYVPPPPKVIPGPYWSNRVYLAAATGTPCVVGWTKGIEEYYDGEKEVLYFRTAGELHDAVRRLLDDAELRERIGLAGRKRTLKDHTYVNRVQTLMRKVFPHEEITIPEGHGAVGVSG